MKRSLPIVGQQVAVEPEAAASSASGAADCGPWRSLEEYAQGPERREGAEFAHGAALAEEDLSRRGFLQIMGASAALAGLTACRPPRQQVHPYVRQPDQPLFPGKSVSYATAYVAHGHAVGLLVRTDEGRPTKVEGNPDHPASLGAAGHHQQATLLDLYDPRRRKGFTKQGQPLPHRALLRELTALAETHAADGGARLRFLVGATSSPTLLDLRRRILERFPRARFSAYESLSGDASREGTRIAFGRQPLAPRYRIAEAQVLLALDADFLSCGAEHLRHTREFASRRTPGERMSRLYVAEAHYSVTGSNADHRFRMRPSQVLPFAREVAAALAADHGLAQLAAAGAGAGNAPQPSKQARAVAEDLARAKGAALVLAGDRQPAALHALVHAMNAALGAAGKTVEYGEPVVPDATGPAGLAELATELREGKVDTLVVTAFNPVYTAPVDLDLEGLLAKAPNVLYHAFRDDETAARASWVLAASHPFETWGDARAFDGTVTILQPLLQPLFESLSEPELLASFLPGEAEKGGYRIVHELWRARSGAGPAFDARWAEWLAKGVVPDSATPPVSVSADFAAVARAVRAEKPAAEGLEVSFVEDEKLLDGRFAENAWLQELPQPLSKLTWDNAALMSPATAQEIGVGSKLRVELRLRGRKIDAPVLVAPGHADGVVTLALGYGRRAAGPVGTGVGVDAGALRGLEHPWFEGGLAVAKLANRKHELAQTQEHFSMEGRPHALAFAAREWEQHGHEKVEDLRGPVPTIHEPVDYEKQPYKWGMAIDLAKCVGCNACTIACQAENNIPVVGKKQVLRSREMHWLRVDRYYEGTPEDPRTIAQPVMCVHCETAPCEYVCPVNATVHSDEGLNEMIYNRCVGTRYCSNNCPYKVRRFNFFDYTSGKAPTEAMLMNPDVTVRSRGVMEKCTYCVQRIEKARIQARVAGTKQLPEFTSACAQACPAQAIEFGDLHQKDSAVAKLHRDERRYDLLHELGTRPRTAYLVRIRNPNPALETT